jgi:hypothetical protein
MGEDGMDGKCGVEDMIGRMVKAGRVGKLGMELDMIFKSVDDGC